MPAAILHKPSLPDRTSMLSRPGTALNGDAPKAMVAKILGFQAKEEEESQETIQQLNTNMRAKADANETQSLQRNACRLLRLQIAFCYLLPHFENTFTYVLLYLCN